MEVRKIRAEMAVGRSIFDLPLRVTFYARVSTDQEEQLNSLENQVQYYTELIQGKKNWTFVPGYIDEGISGTSTKKRDDFNRMIRDARAGLFDFIITKEISRFSRTTLDSIKYTQALLDYNVGVLFQNDNINTLDSDSEFRLVIMAGVAQDEVRKLSERIRFGFRQSIKNGRVLGNDCLYGYDKKDCVLTINEKEAEIIRIVFDLYGNEGLGTRSISRKLRELGYTSREGNDFNTLTIRHMLENPKYKGWYCGNKSQSLDYRTQKKAFLEEQEWVMYPDPGIPAIVSEDLWNRANALYKARRKEMMERGSGASYHNRYPYSTKIICEDHGTTYHRHVLQKKTGAEEVWQCKIYRTYGRQACAAPQIRSCELDQILSQIFEELVKDPQIIVDSLLTVLGNVPGEVDYGKLRGKVRYDMAAMNSRKERILDLHIGGVITLDEFRVRNNECNRQLRNLEAQLDQIDREEAQAAEKGLDMEAIRRTLETALNFSRVLDSALVSTILERVVVKKESTRKEIHLDIYLKMGQRYQAIYVPQKVPASIIRERNTTHRFLIRKI